MSPGGATGDCTPAARRPSGATTTICGRFPGAEGPGLFALVPSELKTLNFKTSASGLYFRLGLLFAAFADFCQLEQKPARVAKEHKLKPEAIMEPFVVFLLVAVPAIVVWCLSVGDLMSRSDDEFPGRSDKLAWAILLSITGIVGAIIWLWKRPPFRDLSAPHLEDDRESAACLQCGAEIPPNCETCPKCGWSYTNS